VDFVKPAADRAEPPFCGLSAYFSMLWPNIAGRKYWIMPSGAAYAGGARGAALLTSQFYRSNVTAK
jgi:hypothetical protein